MSTIALEYVRSVPWAILPRALDGIEALAERDMESFRTAFAEVPKASHEMVSARGGDRIEGTWATSIRDGVAVVPVRGVISRYSTMMQEMCREGTSVELLAKDLRKCIDNEAVKSILLDVDSPGGEAAGIGELASMIRSLSARKPIHAYVGGLGASAGYWLPAACASITCHPTAFLGSIGVVCSVNTDKKKGIVTFASSNAPLKRPDFTTDEGKAVLQGEVDALETQFIGSVAAFRDTTTAKVQSEFGRGGIKMGQDAVDAGMADTTGDFESTLAAMASGAWQPARRVKTESKPAPSGITKGASPKMFSFSKFFGLVADKDPKLAAEITAELNGDSSDIHAVMKRLEASATTAQTPSVAVSEDAIRAKLETEYKAKLETEKANVVRELYAAQAKSYFAGAVMAGVLVPAEVPALQAFYIDAAVKDASAKLSFVDAAGKTTEYDRLEVLTSLIKGKNAKHAFLGEAITTSDDGTMTLPAGMKLISPQGNEVDESAARKAKLRKGAGL